MAVKSTTVAVRSCVIPQGFLITATVIQASSLLLTMLHVKVCNQQWV